MAKRHQRKPTRKPRKPTRRPKSGKRAKQTLVIDRIPSAATFFRFRLVDAQTRDLTGKLLSKLKPIIWMRDRDRVKQIEQAKTPQELVDRVALAGGLAEDTWHERMSEFGPEILPLVTERLRTAKQIRDRDDRGMIYERLLADLRWRGEDGAKVLMECFDELDDYGQSLACVILGLLEVHSSANKMWAFYKKVKGNQDETYFVGALWGLVDLKDERACEALVDLLYQRRSFYEMFGFFSLVGDARTVQPLWWAIGELTGDDQLQPTMALVSVAHRIGREALIAEIAEFASSDESPEEIAAAADTILARSSNQAEEYFALFYRGFTSQDAARMIKGFTP